MRCAGVGVLVAAALAATVVRAQDEPQTAPTFRSEIHYVQLPVRVLDSRGEFVSGLAQSDFQVLEDGAPQTITAFSAVEIPVIAGSSIDAAAPAVPVDPVASNESAQVDGRVYMFVLDNRATKPADTLKVRQVMRSFIEQRLGANDLAALVFTGNGRSQDFTRNRALLIEAVDRFIGSDDLSGPDRAHHTLTTIARVSEWLGSIRGRRKALILVTTSEICVPERSECAEELRHTLRTAMQSDVSIYAVDPRGLVATQGAPAEIGFRPAGLPDAIVRGPLDGARYLAEESGGFALVNTNSIAAGFERIVRENSSYYLLGYYSANIRADGKFRRNAVTVARRGLQVVHRHGYNGPKAGELSTVETIAPKSVAERLRELEHSPLPVSAMSLRVAAAPFLTAGGASSVAVTVEMLNRTLKPSSEDGRYRLGIGLSINLYDRDGKVVGGEDPTIDLDVPLAAGPRVTAEGIRIVSRITVPPGPYRIMVGATQTPSGVGGSVMTEIVVPDFGDHPLALSGLVVSTADALRMYTARTDELLDDVLGAPPVAYREFPAEGELWIYGEIYDHRTAAGDVTASVVVTSDEGKAVYTTPFEPAPVQFGHLARIPLAELAPGRYVATIDARSTTPKPVSATRAVAFTVR